MLAESKGKAIVGIGLGFGIAVAGWLGLEGPSILHGAIQIAVITLGWCLGIWGCTLYAKGKGYSRWLGLLGLFAPIGLLVLFFLPDRHKEPTRA
jgi:hypothetical protein